MPEEVIGTLTFQLRYRSKATYNRLGNIIMYVWAQDGD